jgi:putative PIN family toxin of toxin-antitoxin system
MSSRAFLDANVLFSAILSPHGAPRKILLLSAKGIIQTVISEQIVEEVERNLSRKYPQFLELFPYLLNEAGVEIVEDAKRETIEEVVAYLPYLPDAAVLAAALDSGANCFITGDKEHFLSRPGLEDHAGVPILSPRGFLDQIEDGEGRS